MKVGFIGAGKVGMSFGKYISNYGIPVSGYHSKTYASAQKAAAYTGSTPYKEVGELLKDSDMIFITTPDDAIERVCSSISKEIGFKRDQIVLHMSGACSSEILKSAKQQGCFVYSLHPLQAFAEANKAVKDLQNTYFSIEGDKEKLSQVIQLIETCGNPYFILKKEDKPLYHSAACVVSNYLVTLMEIGLTLFDQAGIDREKGFEALSPLIRGSLDNVGKLRPAKALTGPIARGDVNTIRNQLVVMEKKCPEVVEIYKLLGRETTKLAQKEKLKDQQAVNAFNKIWKEGV